MIKSFLLLILILISTLLTAQNAWINEFHYDNTGIDADELIEIVIEDAGTYTISDFTVYLYSGADGLTYDNKDLSLYTMGDTEGDFTFYYYMYPVNGIQNGDPDGIALLYQGNLIPGQFLSYEGTFTAVDGPIIGESSVDMGFSQSSSTPTGVSLQLTNAGMQYSDFNWMAPTPFTIGSLNNGQSFCPLCPKSFTATPISSSQIDLSWLQNTFGHDVLVAYSMVNTFGVPADGTAYSVADPISGGGTVIYNGSGLAVSHTGLTAATQYFYEAWSLDGVMLYSDGVSANAITMGVTTVSNGDILITEIMQNPSAVDDTDGEWFEMYNSATFDIDIDGWTISDNDIESHTINNGGSLIIPAGGFLVLGRNSNTSTNGGVAVDYAYTTFFTLANSDDEIVLSTPTSDEISRIEYDGGTNWPNLSGTSMIYIGTLTDINDDGSNWTSSHIREAGYTTATGDLGSPATNGLFQNLITTTTWTGTGNWSEGNPPAGAIANWSNGSPGTEVDVIISGTVTVDMSVLLPAVCGSLNLLFGQILTVDSNNGLVINGTLTDEDGTFTIETGGYVEVR